MNIHIAFTVISLIIAYLLGSVSTSILISKLAKIPDPRQVGSGNPGATNMLRVAGKKLAALTLVGDVCKGLMAVLIARFFFNQCDFYLGLVAFAAILGHIYPIFHKFKGGKGVATAFGAILGLSPLLGLAVVLTWLTIAFIFRYSSLAALVACSLAPVYALFLAPPKFFIGLALIAILILWRHRENLERLRHRTEKKIGEG
jgi:glycerol-3-phosphate acyltransferase PlsY